MSLVHGFGTVCQRLYTPFVSELAEFKRLFKTHLFGIAEMTEH